MFRARNITAEVLTYPIRAAGLSGSDHPSASHADVQSANSGRK